MLEFATIADADRYALILANASILSIVLNFGQTSNMQARFSDSGFSSIAVQGIFTAFAIALPLALTGILVLGDPALVAINLLFALAMTLTAQYNVLLRCSKKFSIAIYAEIIRTAVFLLAVTFIIIIHGRINLLTMVLTMVVYYTIPYTIMAVSVRSSFPAIRTAISETWSDRPRLLHWTLSASLTAGAWVVIRYVLAFLGGEGDLARFSAIMSICSAGVILADLLYVRISRTIVSGAKGNRLQDVMLMLKVVASGAALGLAVMLVASVGYICVALDASRDLIILALFLSLGYAARFFYIFGQQIMIARGLATYDLAGGVAMMIVALSASWLLIPGIGVAGAGVSFFLTAVAMLIVISWGARRHWEAS